MSLAVLWLLSAQMAVVAAAFPAHPHGVSNDAAGLAALDRRIDAAFHGGTRRELRRLLFKSVDLDCSPVEVRTLAWSLTMATSDDDLRMERAAFVFSDAEFSDLGGLNDPVLAAIARAKAGGSAKSRAVYEWALKHCAPEPRRFEDYGDALALEEGWRLRLNGREPEAVPFLADASALYDKALEGLARVRTLDALRARLLIKQANVRLTLSRIDRTNAAVHRATALAGYRSVLSVPRPSNDHLVDMEGATWKAIDVWGKSQDQARRHLSELE